MRGTIRFKHRYDENAMFGQATISGHGRKPGLKKRRKKNEIRPEKSPISNFQGDVPFKNDGEPELTPEKVEEIFAKAPAPGTAKETEDQDLLMEKFCDDLKKIAAKVDTSKIPRGNDGD